MCCTTCPRWAQDASGLTRYGVKVLRLDLVSVHMSRGARMTVATRRTWACRAMVLVPPPDEQRPPCPPPPSLTSLWLRRSRLRPFCLPGLGPVRRQQQRPHKPPARLPQPLLPTPISVYEWMQRKLNSSIVAKSSAIAQKAVQCCRSLIFAFEWAVGLPAFNALSEYRYIAENWNLWAAFLS